MRSKRLELVLQVVKTAQRRMGDVVAADESSPEEQETTNENRLILSLLPRRSRRTGKWTHFVLLQKARTSITCCRFPIEFEPQQRALLSDDSWR